MSSQRFCLRWNNHQTNLLSVFDQLLHDETFIDVTLAVEGQHLKAHKMVLSACSPYFQQLFVNHPERHPIVILRDIPYKDMKCLLDFMYRGEVSVDQDRLAAFLRVAESLKIKGLTEVNDDKPSGPPSSSSSSSPSAGGGATAAAAGSTTTQSTGSSGGSHTTGGGGGGGGAGAGSAGTRGAHTTASTVASTPGSGSVVSAASYNTDDGRTSPALGSINAGTSPAQAQIGGSQLKQLPPLIAASGIVTRSHSNSLLHQNHHSTSGSSMLQTNPLLGSALSQQKRKRGRPRKLSGSDTGGEGESFPGADEYDSSSMDVMDVKMTTGSGGSNSGDEEGSGQLRIVTSRSGEDDEVVVHHRRRTDDAGDDEDAIDDAEDLVDDEELLDADEQQDEREDKDGATPSVLDDSMEIGAGEQHQLTNNNNSSNRNQKRQQQQLNNVSKLRSGSKRSKTVASTNLRNNENSMSGSPFFPCLTTALSIFPIGNGNGPAREAEIVTDGDEDSDEEISFVLPKFEKSILKTPRKETMFNTHKSLLDRLDRQELTITERPAINSANDVPSPPSHGTDSCSDVEDMEGLSESCAPSPNGHSAGVANGNDFVDNTNGTITPRGPPRNSLAKKRRSRKTISPDDPAESLTEMSVRGLNLFRYATVNAGVYECMECSKEGAQKTFKNKYSFQRHAFLYHEGQQRKVFPCPVCSKDFSRPDKMKNHLRMMHGGGTLYEPKGDHPVINASDGGPHCAPPPKPKVDMMQLHLHLQQRQLHQLHQQNQQHHSDGAMGHQLQEELDKRRQQEQDVLKIRQAVNAITLRQLQQLRSQLQEKEDQREQNHNQHHPHASQQAVALGQQRISNSNLKASVPSQQLLALGGLGSQ